MKDAEPLQGKAHGCVLTAPLKCEEGGSRMRTVSPSARERMTIVPDSATMNNDAPRPRRYNDEPNGNYRPAPARRDVGFTQEDIQQNKAMAVLAYFGILVLIPLFAAKHSRYARYHTNQGLALCIAAIIYSVVYGILSSVLLAISWRLYFVLTILGVVSIFFFVLMIIGIVNAAGGKTKPLPLVGKMRILKY